MRISFLSALPAALVAVACARVPPLQSAGVGQAIDGAPNEAQAEVAGVTVHAAIGGWRGRPQNLEQRLTPVDVTLHNVSGRTIRIGPEAFTLRTPSGPSRALDQVAAAAALRDLSGPRVGQQGPRVGAVGGPTFPGYDAPGNPYAPWSRSPPGTPVPPLAQWYETQSLSGTLSHGAQTSILLFFGTPARTLAAATFEVELVDDEGTALGKVEMPFARD
jgi:hypothetical protein